MRTRSVRRARNLVLIGFMGTGKSTVGKMCAKRLGYAFCDSDAVIEERVGCTIPELFATQGEAVFRQKEREVIAELALTPNLVIATGGGVVMDAENVANLRAEGLVILLRATPEVILKRVGDARSRPLLAVGSDPQARIEELLSLRAEQYERAAHLRLDTTDRSVPEIVTEAVRLYRRK